MAFAGYRIVVLTPLANGGEHRTPWSRWLSRDLAENALTYRRQVEPGRTLAIESKRGVLYGVSA
jgi:hypothetical protein